MINAHKINFVVVQLLNCVWLCDPHGLQHVRLPCPSLSSRVCSNSWPLCQWRYLNNSSSCPQSFPASGSFPVSRLFTSGAQSVGASASASVLPVSIQGWFPLGWTGLISLQSKGLSRVFSNTTVHRFTVFLLKINQWELLNNKGFCERGPGQWSMCQSEESDCQIVKGRGRISKMVT